MVAGASCAAPDACVFTGGPGSHSSFVSSPRSPVERQRSVWPRCLSPTSIPGCSSWVWKVVTPCSAARPQWHRLCTTQAALCRCGRRRNLPSPRTVALCTPWAAPPSTGKCWAPTLLLHLRHSYCLALNTHFSGSPRGWKRVSSSKEFLPNT